MGRGLSHPLLGKDWPAPHLLGVPREARVAGCSSSHGARNPVKETGVISSPFAAEKDFVTQKAGVCSQVAAGPLQGSTARPWPRRAGDPGACGRSA